MTTAPNISLTPPVGVAAPHGDRWRYPRYPLVLAVSAAVGLAVAGLEVVGALALMRLIG
jgi:hypothetical protein